MLPLDSFKNTVSKRFDEENDDTDNYVPVRTIVGKEAKEYIKRIYDDGAEQVLDEILSDDTDDSYDIPVPDENYYNKIQVEDHVIYWSKSGAEPLVAIYQVAGEAMENNDLYERPRNIDREAVESASHFILRGFDENTVGRVVDDACGKCYDTEEAIGMVRSLIKEDPRLSAFGLDEEEEGLYNEYRHSLRKNFLGMGEVLNPKMYELDMAGGLNDPSQAQPTGDPETQTKMAEIQAQMAEKQAAHAEEMAKLQKQLENLKGGKSGGLFEKTDPNKGSQLAGFRHEGGPQALANAISQLQWGGPGSQFDIFLNEITVDGYNMIGSAATSAGTEQEPSMGGEQPTAEPSMGGAPMSPEPSPEPQPDPNEPDLSSL